MKKIAVYVMLSAFALATLAGCGKEERKPAMSLHDFAKIHHTDFSADGTIAFGVVSDLEGAIKNAEVSAAKLAKENIDAVIIAGDLYENESMRRNPVYPRSRDNVQEAIDGITPYAELGVPVFLIPGNHETQTLYGQIVQRMQETHPLVFDLHGQAVDFDGVNIAGVGGWYNPRFVAQGGYVPGTQDYAKINLALKRLSSQNEPAILITHGPPLSNNSNVDVVPGVGHVGDPQLASVLVKEQGITNMHGHIHEGGGSIATYEGGSKALNVASITPYNAEGAPRTAVVRITGKEVTHSFIK